MYREPLPPAVVNAPPAYRSLPDTASARTVWFSPEPSRDQLLPFHLAMLLAELPPAVVKRPPAYTSLARNSVACGKSVALGRRRIIENQSPPATPAPSRPPPH